MTWSASEYIGSASQKVASWLDSVTSRFVQRVGVEGRASDGTINPIGAEDLGSGFGLYAITLNKQWVKGVMAIGGDLTGEFPVYVGGFAASSIVNATPQTEALNQAAKLTVDGRRVSFPWTVPADQMPTTPIALTTTGDVSVYTAISDQKYAVVGLLIDNVSAVDTTVIVKGASTVIGRCPAPKRGSGVAPAALPLQLRTNVNEALNFALSDAATTVHVTPLVYKTKL